MEEKIKELKARREGISTSPEQMETVHQKGKRTAEERLQSLFDDGIYEEVMPWAKNRCLDFELYKKDVKNEGVICGFGKVDNRTVFSYAHDSSVMGGSTGEGGNIKMNNFMDKAIEAGSPIVSFNDAPGARIQEGVAGLNSYCTLFGKTGRASGWVPQISIISGLCAGGTAYCAAMTDFIIQVEPIGKMFITGPSVIKKVTGQETTFDEIGSGRVHGPVTGLSHFVVNSEQEAVDLAKWILSFLPSNSKESAPSYACTDSVGRRTDEISDIVPTNPLKAFDVRDVIRVLVDDGQFLEIQKDYAMNMVAGLARMGGSTVGIIGNQPQVLAGCIDVKASWKAARFVQFCDSYNIPVIVFADTPGYLPGVEQEHSGIIRHGSKLLFAFAESTTPKITVVLRKDYGGAYSAMCGKGMGADFVYALPTGELAIMGAEGAAEIVYKKEINSAEDPKAKFAESVEDYKRMFMNPYRGAEYGIIDDIVEPFELRRKLCVSLDLIRNKVAAAPYKKHSNVPL